MPDNIIVETHFKPDSKMINPEKTKEKSPEFPCKKLILEPEAPLTASERKILDKIQKKFSKNDFQIEITDDKIILYLHSIDLEAFKTCIHGLLSTTDDKKVNKTLILELVEKISRIRSYGVKGGKRVFAAYNDERKVEDRQSKVTRRGQYYYAQDNKFPKKNNTAPKKLENVVICDDSRHALQRLPDNCIDLIITSPPYNFGLGYDTSKDGVNWENYFHTLFAIFDECIRVLKYGGRIIVNIQPLFSDYIPSHHIISNHFIEKKMIWKGEILWEKNNYNCKYTAWGSWKSPGSPYLKYTWEFLEIFAKGDLKKDGDPKNIDITADEFKKWVVAKWSIAPERKMVHYDHPAMFPEELVERALKLFSYEGDIILDPFNGTGTTCVAAKRFNRKYIGIDVSQKYCTIAEKRLKEIFPGTNSSGEDC
ncbi:site-specific DNA-methyltransferase [Methanoregula sp.]|uniref:DNA-methyltransferase n=1 Tax=Methanoregula sp. TaxID=2052170 RepID=UPI0026103FDA|nr:site-specific DNA-methyltransferase [Methanoregula sp.]MDD5142221.1 site-specific DNA-methyltransferase [Methanoregula sp.]